MKITILNGSQLHHYYLKFNVPLAGKVMDLLVAILNDAYEDDHSKCVIDIHTKFLPPSYVKVPSMLARQLVNKVEYLSVQAQIDSSAYRVRIIGANVKTHLSFRSRLLHGLKMDQRFVSLRKHIPKSYRARPGLLIKDLEEELDGDIAIIAKPTKIIWKIR